jgi:hypothetical protein
VTAPAMSKSRARTPATSADQPPSKERAWSDESLAPAIDQTLLQKLIRRELPEAKARDVYRFVHSFASWNDAYNKAVVAEERARKRKS